MRWDQTALNTPSNPEFSYSKQVPTVIKFQMTRALERGPWLVPQPAQLTPREVVLELFRSLQGEGGRNWALLCLRRAFIYPQKRAASWKQLRLR